MEGIGQQLQFISTSAHSIDIKINEMLSSDFGKTIENFNQLDLSDAEHLLAS